MRETTATVICIVGVAVAIAATIIGVNFINRDKVHVPSQEEVYSNECAKRGGHLIVKDTDTTEVDTIDRSCEVTK